MQDKNANLHEIQVHFKNFVSSNPKSTYEEWIGSLHPEAAGGCLLEGIGSGSILLDHEYYTEGNEHRNVWNSDLGEGIRMQVPASPSCNDPSSVVMDLLGGGPSSPVASDRSISEDQDLLTFD